LIKRQPCDLAPSPRSGSRPTLPDPRLVTGGLGASAAVGQHHTRWSHSTDGDGALMQGCSWLQRAGEVAEKTHKKPLKTLRKMEEFHDVEWNFWFQGGCAG